MGEAEDLPRRGVQGPPCELLPVARQSGVVASRLRLASQLRAQDVLARSARVGSQQTPSRLQREAVFADRALPERPEGVPELRQAPSGLLKAAVLAQLEGRVGHVASRPQVRTEHGECWHEVRA